jgi:hypothetical protein
MTRAFCDLDRVRKKLLARQRVQPESPLPEIRAHAAVPKRFRSAVNAGVFCGVPGTSRLDSYIDNSVTWKLSAIKNR